ncbi:hypothetical protein CSAL01_08011 [Colletotrichum salicis]|uniref:C2H2-type domain-containing protein n=1 Tax=Colletotrichum salicis TaxID=1209931 RepID=A0A135S4X0_9PEZI|nr:hypothetical protein CSAL01_08011 [Colletotrichum salicis]
MRDTETPLNWDRPLSEGVVPHTPLSSSTLELSPFLDCEQEVQFLYATDFLSLGKPTIQSEFPVTKHDKDTFVQFESHKGIAGGCSTASGSGLGGNINEIPSLVEFIGKEPVPPNFKRSSEKLVPIVQAPAKRQRFSSPPDHAIHMSESIDDDDATIKGITGYFACPFYRNNAVRHTACLNLRMVRIRDVKQHLQRRHTEPRHYCPTCYKRFETYLEQSQHVQNQSIVGCSPKDEEFDFVPPHAKDLLKFKVSRKVTAEEQWYTVWDAIFKPKERPKHPYMGTVIEEVTTMLHEFWQHEGDQILSRFMETRQVKIQDDVCLKDTLHGLMNTSYQMFGRRFRTSQSMERSISSSSNEQQCNPEDQGSGALYDEDTEDFITRMASLDQKGYDSLSYDLSTSQQALQETEDTTTWNGIFTETAPLDFTSAEIDFTAFENGR